VAALLAVGGLPSQMPLELSLLDSLYGNLSTFDSFVREAIATSSLGLGPQQRRFYTFYTDLGGTEQNNRAMAARVAGWLAAANASALLRDDDGLGPLTPAEVGGYPVVFKRSPHTHDDTCRDYFKAVLAWDREGP
jgi:hypothetical protein